MLFEVFVHSLTIMSNHIIRNIHSYFCENMFFPIVFSIGTTSLKCKINL